MLHPRYGNYASCIYHMFKEEGLKGFYRGYIPHMLATGITLTIVPMLAQSILEKSNLYGKSKSDQVESLHDEVTQRQERINSIRKK